MRVRRYLPFAALALLVLLLPGPAVAAGADDDIPGTSLQVGSSVSGTVDATDLADIYAVALTAGEEVHVRLDPGNTVGVAGRLHLLVPGASSIAEAGSFDEIMYDVVGGTPMVDKHGAYFDYIPAKSGACYLGVEWKQGALNYTLSVVRTSRSALDLAVDADALPGAPVSDGTLTGVVSTLADPHDVYAVALAAGKPVTIELIPLTPYANYFAAKARLRLLMPDASALDAAGGVAAGPAEAVAASTDGERETATIQYSATTGGTYHLVVDAGPFVAPLYGMDFAYQLTIAGAVASGDGAGDGGAVTGETGDFSDVSGSPYSAAIYDLAGEGVITGYEDGTFRPNASVTRQQFAKMIVKALGYAVTGSETSPYTDVAAKIGSDPYYPAKYVAVCALHGITTGKTATRFDPGSTITHQQLITMVARAAALADPPASYSPSFSAPQFSLSDHYANARKAAYAGLLDGLQGMGPGFDFKGPSTRGECVQVLFNLTKK